MSLTLTAVPAASLTDLPTPTSPTELQAVDFAAILQSSPMSGMPEMANPAALAGEVFNHLRGFVERAHRFQNVKLPPPGQVDDGNLTQAFVDGGRTAGMFGGPALDDSALSVLVPTTEEGSSVAQPVAGNTLADPQNILSDESRIGLADLQRFIDFGHAMFRFSVESRVVAAGLTQGVHAINTLLKAQ
jgi:hypothetical protein